MADTQTVTRPYAHWPKTALRIGFGVIWLIDAILKWLPGFRSDYMDTLMGQAQGQPGWLKPWFDFWINLQHPRAAFFAYLVAMVETLADPPPSAAAAGLATRGRAAVEGRASIVGVPAGGSETDQARRGRHRPLADSHPRGGVGRGDGEPVWR